SESKSPAPLTSPLRDNNIRLNDPQDRMVVAFHLRDLNQEIEKRLHQELQKGATHAMDLRCSNAVAGMDRLQNAFKSQGIQFVLDPDASAALELGMGKSTTFALYFSDITAEELVAVLQQLSGEDRDAERKRSGTGR